jgi:hypothetical protein
MAFALIFSCVVSCDEQEDKVETKNESVTRAIPNGRLESDFNGSEGDPIDLTTAKQWTANYRVKFESRDEISAHFFGSEIIQQILGESNCVGIRIYYAINDSGEKKLILVGVDSNGENLLPSMGGRISDGGNILADYSWPCPDYCPENGL